MKPTDEFRLFLECTLGSKSHLNTFGKVVFSPLIIALGLCFLLLDTLFSEESV